MKKRVLLFIGLYLASGLAVADVKFVSDSGFIVENSVQIDTTTRKAWRTLIRDVDKWWPKDHTWWGEEGRLSIGTKAGDCFCEVSGRKSVEHMRVSFVDPGTLLRMTGGLGPLQGMGMFGALDWRFESIGDGTQITLTYTVNGISPDGFAELAPIVASVQGIQLNALKVYLQGK